MVKWTKNQGAAIDLRKSNLLVAAAAGSGKTAVLVERIIQLIIKDKVDIDRLLIVTFTNAAAGEMRERIGNALLSEIEKGNENENETHLRRQTTLLNRASISTLHSFCIEVVRKYFHLINIDPGFRIGDSTEIAILKMEVLEEVFEEAYTLGREEFHGLVERFGGSKEDVPLQELVLKLYEFIQSKPYPLKWLQEKVEDFSMDMDNAKNHTWFKAIKKDIEMQLSGALSSLMQAKKLCESPRGPSGYLEGIKDDIAIVEQLYSAKDLDIIYDLLWDFKHKRLGRNPKDTDDNLIYTVKDLREQAKEIVKDIQGRILAKSPKEYLEDLNELYPFMEYLYELVLSYDTYYREKKIEKGIVDFNDLEHYALDILEHEEPSKDYQKKYEYIFIDEYQDSNIVQETILNFIKRQDNLFMVGDVKQSIYRFRLADPSLFIQKYESFNESADDSNRRIDLSKNFRSRDKIINGVNYIFKALMSKEFGEIDYDENAFLYKGGEFMEFPDPAIELEIIEKDSESKEEIDEDIEELVDMEAEAIRIADRIKTILDTQLYDNKMQKYRNINYSDIVILLRTTKNWSQTFLEILGREGIPVYADVNTGYFETIEINIFTSLLKIIDNKRQDIPLLSIMRSPIGGFSTEELIKIRLGSNASTFYDGIKEYIDTGEEGLKSKLMAFMKKLNNWKEMSRYMPMDEFIWKLYTGTGFYYYVGAMPGGKQRQGNLRVLVDRARQFQSSSIRGLFNFIKFIDKLKSSSGDMGTAKTLGENDNVVRIMSIHKSKGLEFPVVIVAGLGKQFNLSDINAPVLFHKDLGIGPKFTDPELRSYTDTLGKIAMSSRIKLETLSEEMRILYVAMTRAKDKLILIGSAKQLMKLGEKWSKPLTPFNLAKGKSFLEWLGHIIIQHENCSEFRDTLGISSFSEIISDESLWKVNIIPKYDIKKDNIIENDKKTNIKKELIDFDRSIDSEISEYVNGRLGWEYPYMEATRIPSKLSVTDIKRFSGKEMDTFALNIPQIVKSPKFMDNKKGFTPMERGTIIHFVMQHIQLDGVENETAIKEQVENMVQRELLRPDEAETVDIQKILLFFQSPIGQRIRNANKVYREVPFNLTQKANTVISEITSCNDALLIQGIIDCYFKEGEDYILVDYKTDAISEYNKNQLVEKYRIQIELYKEALEKITGKKVKESYLYLFSLDQEVRL